MPWWGNDLGADGGNPKQKNRFIVEFGRGGMMLSLSTITKPSVTIESKEYRMINHFYNYPGIPKWEPITLTFVDNFIFSMDQSGFFENSVSPYLKSTSGQLFEMLLATGYMTPSGANSKLANTRTELAQRNAALDSDNVTAEEDQFLGLVKSPEKAANISAAFGDRFVIYQLDPAGGTKETPEGGQEPNYTEKWTIFNPIITKISWGELDYGDDGLVQYTLDVTYDWAEHTDNDGKDNFERPIAGPGSE